MSDVTRILNAIERGDARSTDELLPIVYKQLRLLASHRLAEESTGQTLQATALVHEAYLRLVEAKNQNWQNRSHFFKAAAEAMRRILIDNARHKKSLKSGGDYQKIDLDELASLQENSLSDDLLSLHEALVKLEQRDKLKASLVKLRYFAGLTIQQTAEILDISPATTKRYWAYARAWLLWKIRQD